MKFLYPEFLWASLCIIIPIIIHLFNFRRYKKINFSNVKLLKEVEMQSKKQSKVKHLWVLFSRILAILCLVFAFSQPYFPDQQSANKFLKNSISIYIDNSFSMESQQGEISDLEIAKSNAVQLLDNYPETDLFYLVTNDFEAQHQLALSKSECINQIQKVTASPASRNLSQIYDRQADQLKTKSEKNNLHTYWFTDFQKSTSSLSAIKLDSNIKIAAILGSNANKQNVFIDSAWIESPYQQLGSNLTVKARLVNQTNEDIECRVALSENENLKSFKQVYISQNTEQDIDLIYKVGKVGMNNLKVDISEYPNPSVLFDDEYFLSFMVGKDIPILVINQNKNFVSDTAKGHINQIFQGDSYFDVKNVDLTTIDYNAFDKYNLIILNQLDKINNSIITSLSKALEKGNSVLIIPSSRIDINSYNELLTYAKCRLNNAISKNQSVGAINLSHPVYQNVFERIPSNIDLPKVNKYYPLSDNNNTPLQHLLTLQDGSVFLGHFKTLKGNMYLSTVSLDTSFSNFGIHTTTLVTSIVRIAELSQKGIAINHQIGESSAISISDYKKDLGDIIVSRLRSNFEFIPPVSNQNQESKIILDDKVNVSGNYTISQNKKDIQVFSANYNRNESELMMYTKEEVEEKMPNIQFIYTDGTNSIKAIDIQKGIKSKLWKYFLIGALLFLLIETVLLRLKRR